MPVVAALPGTEVVCHWKRDLTNEDKLYMVLISLVHNRLFPETMLYLCSFADRYEIPAKCRVIICGKTYERA